jgi:YD repeat-containing protein
VSTYDAAGNLRTTTTMMDTSPDRTTTYTHDALNRPMMITDPLGQVTGNRYDRVGNLIAQIDPLGHTTTNVYDRLDRRTEVRDPLNHVTKTAYDEANNVTRVTDPNNNVTSYQYDGMDRLRKEIQGTQEGKGVRNEWHGNFCNSFGGRLIWTEKASLVMEWVVENPHPLARRPRCSIRFATR